MARLRERFGWRAAICGGAARRLPLARILRRPAGRRRAEQGDVAGDERV